MFFEFSELENSIRVHSGSANVKVFVSKVYICTPQPTGISVVLTPAPAPNTRIQAQWCGVPNAAGGAWEGTEVTAQGCVRNQTLTRESIDSAQHKLYSTARELCHSSSHSLLSWFQAL